jgi:predicted transcriptional regulator
MTSPAPSPVAIKLDPQIRERIKRLAQTRQRTPHWLMREAISQYLEREEKRENFRQAGLSAWQEYQATRLGVAAQSADRWMAELERGVDSDPPEAKPQK